MYIVTIIAGLTFIGLLGMLRSVVRIHSYKKRFKSFEYQFKNSKRESNLQKFIEEFLKNNETKDPLVGRLKSIKKAYEDENGACRLPSLHDLNELTLQEEFGQCSSSALRIVISFLLIVGIWGTLSGVETLLKDGNINLKELSPALEPSMCAVGCTVLLVWARGVYECYFRRYIKELNSFTVKELLPRLHPVRSTDAAYKSIQENVDEFRAKMKDLDESIKAFEEIGKQLGNEVHLLTEKEESIITAKKRISDMDEQMKKNEDVRRQEREAIEGIFSKLCEGGEHRKSLQEKTKLLDEIRHGFDDSINKFVELTHKVERSSQNLYGGAELLKDLSEMTSQIPIFAREMRVYVNSLRQVCNKHDSIASASLLFREQSKNLVSLENEISQLEVKSREIHASSASCLDSLRRDLAQYKSELSGFDTELRSCVEAIKLSETAFNKAKNNLQIEIKKRLDDKVGLSSDTSSK